MPLTLNRDIRRMQNAKESSIASGDSKNIVSHSPAVRTMRDGEQVFAQESNKPLTLYKKNKGALWKIALSKDGNQTVEKNSEVKGKLKVNGSAAVLRPLRVGTNAEPDSGAVSSYAQSGLDVSYGGFTLLLGADNNATSRTNSTQKVTRIGNYHYTNAQEPLTLIVGDSGSGVSNVNIGGGTSAMNATENIKLYTAATDTTVTGTVAMLINNAQRVGLPTVSGSHKLSVTGTAGLSTGTAWTDTSDVRIKTNVETVTGGLDKINQLRPVSFNYTSDYLEIHSEIDGSKKYNSFIANEYAEVFPDAVSVGGNLERITPSSDIGEPDDVEVLIEDLLQYTPHDLHIYLVKAVQELSAKVTALENN